MNDIYFPEELLPFIKNKNYEIDKTGMSDSSVLLFDDMVLKISPIVNIINNEHKIMNWLKNSGFVPDLLSHFVKDDFDYLLMSRISGKMACTDEYMKNQNLLINILADAMKMLWNSDISACPIKNDLNTRLAEAGYRVEHGLVDIDDAEPETFGEGGFKNPQDLLEWLYNNQPAEDFVLSHGDFCLPNVFIENDKFSGFVDVGKMGVSDRYQDIALCYRSLKHNFSGKYSGTAYGDFDEDLFFKCLGIKPDWDKIKYYILLDELF